MWLEAEALVEHLLQLAAQDVAVVVGRDEDVCRSAVKPLVTVQTWRSCASTTPWCADDRAADGVGVDLLRRALQEDPRRLAQQRERAQRQSAATKSEAIGSKRFQPVTRMSAPATAVPANAAMSVATWRKAARMLMLRCEPPISDRRRERVDGDRRERDGEHDPAVHLDGVDQAADGAVDDPGGDEEEADPVEPARRAPPRARSRTSSARAAGRRGELRRPERAGEREHVREHVARVGEERERVRDEPGGELRHEERRDERERDRERAAILGAVRVVVAVVVRVRHERSVEAPVR